MDTEKGGFYCEASREGSDNFEIGHQRLSGLLSTIQHSWACTFISSLAAQLLTL
jgi:hypothetical protein